MLMQNRARVLVIGLDGATWNIIKPLVEEGKLPTIQKLMRNGCYGSLESCIIPSTFPAWKCYSTGKNPGKLGVYWYFGVDMTGEKTVLHNSTSFKSAELWDILGQNNITCGVLDMPTTYPPKAIKGFMVSHGAPSPSGYTYPKELEKELKERFNYKLEPDYHYQLDEEATIGGTKYVIEQRFKVAGYLLREFNPTFFHMTIFHIDPIQHFYPGEVVEGCWVLIDNGISSLLEQFCDEQTHVILMSDHGMTERKCTFQMGQWLMERDLVTLKKRRLLLASLLYKLGLRSETVLSLIGKTRIIPWLRLRIPGGMRRRFAAFFPLEDENFSPNAFEGSIDWAQSKIIPVPGLFFYVNRKLFGSEKECEEFKKSVIQEIEEIEEPKTGKKFASAVRREEIYFGEQVKYAPDIIVLPREGYSMSTSPRKKTTWGYSTEGWRRMHKLHGIFLACGPGIKEGIEIKGASIYDLAPTILHLLGIPIPKDMDGRVLKEIFREDSALAKREIGYEELDERQRVKQKIKGLKALGKI
jgi:predicted AlkP superfamily phosphohydrolase/phosphomutase